MDYGALQHSARLELKPTAALNAKVVRVVPAYLY